MQHVPAWPALIELEFGSARGPRCYLSGLASLLHDTASSLRTIEKNGRIREGASLADLQGLIDDERLFSIEYRVVIGEADHRINLKPVGETVQIRTTLIEGCPPTGLLWVQAAAVPPRPFSVVALPVHRHGLTIESFHPLVALGVYTGKLTGAVCSLGPQPHLVGRWTIEWLGPDSLPVTSHHQDRLWLAERVSEWPVIWYTPATTPAWLKPQELDDEWWEELRQLCAAEDERRLELESHLARLLPGGLESPRWGLDDFSTLAPGMPGLSTEDRPVLILRPESDRVRLGLEPGLTATQKRRVLLHGLAHLALGHVRPGDGRAHLDTLASVINPTRHRDLLAARLVERYWTQPHWRSIESLADCTAAQKVSLGLWKILDDRLGKTPHLHERATRYQAAVYQREAAARLVGMLDQHRGAMLCDGVGLGKTYVATTVIVHYVNQWLDQLQQSGLTPAEAPFRVTVIVPNQVENIWKSEALTSILAYGVNPATVRVIPHSRFSNIAATNQMLARSASGISDLEHLLLSDLVIIDEAHAFRSARANRTTLLRNILRMQPTLEGPRRVLLLTATPINNQLDDLRFQLSLMFGPLKPMSTAEDEAGYRREAAAQAREIVDTIRWCQNRKDVKKVLARFFPTAPATFRAEVDFGLRILNLDRYLTEQRQQLDRLIEAIRGQVESQDQLPLFNVVDGKNRIAEELLDQIIVQRSRAMCCQIEDGQGAAAQLLFRTGRSRPEGLKYARSSATFEPILASLLPLFGSAGAAGQLTFHVYLWQQVRSLKRVSHSLDTTGSVIGLQRTQILKRLESSLASFLISLVRLIVTNANRLDELRRNARHLAQPGRASELEAELAALFNGTGGIGAEKMARILQLVTGQPIDPSGADLLAYFCQDGVSDQAVAKADDLPVGQDGGNSTLLTPVQFDNLWRLKPGILSDFSHLLRAIPPLIDQVLGGQVLGRQTEIEWPRKFVTGKDRIDWPQSVGWGRRVVTDEKILELVGFLLRARRRGQKVVVFSQFAHSVDYINSVLKATSKFTPADWDAVLATPGLEQFARQDFEQLRQVTEVLTSNTGNREPLINRFAPYYRIGPHRPVREGLAPAEWEELDQRWKREWTEAITRPVDILLTTDILSEGVNLQDVAVLVNFDLHWNPVKMIQRAGRIDRRLNPRIEGTRDYPELEELAARLNRPVPRYYWHDHPHESPRIFNMILPEKLEHELQLVERISTRTLLIDLAFGLDQGTGVEADWLEGYDFNGVNGLNATAGDRAIERMVSHRFRLARELEEAGISTDWASELAGWFRGQGRAEWRGLVVDLGLESPYGGQGRYQLGQAVEPVAGDNGRVTARLRWRNGSPPEDGPLRELDHQLLLAALESLATAAIDEHPKLTVDEIEGYLRARISEESTSLRRFEIREGTIRTPFVYAYGQYAEQGSLSRAVVDRAERSRR